MAPELYDAKSYYAKAPGSLMLLGEHAVLYGKPAIVCAIDKFITVKLLVDNNLGSNIKINNDTYGLANLKIQKPYEYVISAILVCCQEFKSLAVKASAVIQGFSLQITSDFSAELGFGSSAAVTAATVAVLLQFLNIPMEQNKIFRLAKRAILQVHACGSCADLAASVYGGVLFYNMQQTNGPDKLPSVPKLNVVYSGAKTPTYKVIELVKQYISKDPKLYENIFNKLGDYVNQAKDAIKHKNWQLLGELFMNSQKLLVKMGISNKILDYLVKKLNMEEKIWGAKISGAGLGDCIIGIGDLGKNIFPEDEKQKQQGILQFSLNIAPMGVTYE